MPPGDGSLLGGRNTAPLTHVQIKRATTVFLGLGDKSVNVRHDPDSRTVFRVTEDERGEQAGEIVFGPDIYPGGNIVDPNSALSLEAACAHELAHFHRWHNMSAIQESELMELDEAFTSLQAVSLYSDKLDAISVKQLVADALQRLQRLRETLLKNDSAAISDESETASRASLTPPSHSSPGS